MKRRVCFVSSQSHAVGVFICGVQAGRARGMARCASCSMGFPDDGKRVVICRRKKCLCGLSPGAHGSRGVSVALASSGVCTQGRVGQMTSGLATTDLSPSKRHLTMATHKRMFSIPTRGKMAHSVAHAPKTGRQRKR